MTARSQANDDPAAPGGEARRRSNARAGSFSVWREDDHGNRFEIEQHLDRPEAERIVAELEARGHKQCYWLAPTRRDP
jgi:hypothetical protein